MHAFIAKESPCILQIDKKQSTVMSLQQAWAWTYRVKLRKKKTHAAVLLLRYIPFTSSAEVHEFMPSIAHTCQEDKRQVSYVSQYKGSSAMMVDCRHLPKLLHKSFCLSECNKDEEKVSRKGELETPFLRTQKVPQIKTAFSLVCKLLTIKLCSMEVIPLCSLFFVYFASATNRVNLLQTNKERSLFFKHLSEN